MADFMRTFNAATDDPENVSKYRAASPIFSSPTKAKPDATAQENSNVEMIGRIPHMKLQSNERAGPLDAMAQGYSGVASALLGGMTPSTRAEEARKKSREGLDTSAEQINPSPSVKPAAIPAPTTVSATPQNPQPNVATNSIADGLDANQRFAAADAYRSAVDSKIGISPASVNREKTINPAGDPGIADMTKRFGAYAKDDDLRAMRNAREDLLGSGIQFQKDASGKLLITNSGKFDPIAAAQGTSIDMSADNKAMAAANATRQQMVDMQPKGGALILRDTAADDWNARMEKEGQVQKITDLMARNPNMAGALSGALNQTVAGQTQQEVEQMRQQGVMAGVDTQRRGQDIAAKNEAARLAGNPMDNSLKQQQVIAAQGANDRQSKLDGILAGIGAENDPAKRSALMEQYLIASGKGGDKRYLSVQGGEEFGADGISKIKRPDSVFDTVTRQAIPLQQQAQSAAPRFNSVADVQAAKAAGKIKSGDIINTPNGMIKVG